MTPEQKLKHLLLIRFKNLPECSVKLPKAINDSNVDELYEQYLKLDNQQVFDEIEKLRRGEFTSDYVLRKTKHLDCLWRNSWTSSETKVVQYLDGSWLAYPYYYYQGDKDNRASLTPWMNQAIEVLCSEELRTMSVQIFSPINAPK